MTLTFKLASCAAAAQVLLAQQPVRLTLKRAVEVATSPEGSARIQIAFELTRQAESRAAQARSALLPNLDAAISEQSATRNLNAFGLRINSPIPGFQIPAFVGPFEIFDVRASGAQTLFDMSAIRRYQAAKAGVGAARTEIDASADQVAAQVAKAYLAALRADADVETSRANIVLAAALVKQAENLKSAGTGTGIEVTRARVQLSNERQRLLNAENQRQAARLRLLRGMNLRLDTPIELADKLTFIPVDRETIEKAGRLAQETRADLKAQIQRESSARLSSNSVRLERLPSLAFVADYGTIGTGPDSALPTRTFGVAAKIPIFDGGRRDARRAQAASEYRAERIRTQDLRDQIALEVRLALDALRSAEEQVKVAAEGLALAENELNQARRRYDAGVATSLEVTDAQTRLARARDNQTAALFLHAEARVDLGKATGTLRSMIE
jgi:outer membrane protein TolC